MRHNTIPILAVKDDEKRSFNSVSECAKALGVSPASVSISVKNKWKVKGYTVSKSN